MTGEWRDPAYGPCDFCDLVVGRKKVSGLWLCFWCLPPSMQGPAFERREQEPVSGEISVPTPESLQRTDT